MVLTLHAGIMNKRVNLLQEATADTVRGDPGQRLYTVRATVWASIRPSGGTEFVDADRTTAETTIGLTIRYRDDVSQSDVVQYKGRMFEIVSVVNEMAKNESLELDCRETQGLVVS